jgi:hypothetical protein
MFIQKIQGTVETKNTGKCSDKKYREILRQKIQGNVQTKIQKNVQTKNTGKCSDKNPFKEEDFSRK